MKGGAKALHDSMELSGKVQRKLGRAELLELLVQVSQENDDLRKENERLRSRLNDRRIALGEAGSIAEAALRLNGIFEAAQKAADDYLRSVRQLIESDGTASVGNVPDCSAAKMPVQPERDVDALGRTVASEPIASERPVAASRDAAGIDATVPGIDADAPAPDAAKGKGGADVPRKRPGHANWL